MSSSFLICMETADGVRNTALAAVVKLPVSAIATKVRSTSRSSSGSGWLSGAFMLFDPSIFLIESIISFRLIEHQIRAIVNSIEGSFRHLAGPATQPKQEAADAK